MGNVSTGKGKYGGCVYRAPYSSTLTLPTDTTTAMSTLSDFVDLGYISEDGVANDNSPSADEIKAWGGAVVLTAQTEKPDTFAFTLISSKSADVLKAVYGSTNVTGTLASGITVKATSDEAEAGAWVFDMVLEGGVAKRIVVPEAKITEIGTINYNDSDAIGYELTITAIAHDGTTHFEYIK